MDTEHERNPMSEQQTTASPAAIAAAEWWAQQIGAPVFKVVQDGATGQDREFGETASFLAGLLASQHPVHEGQGERFVAALAATITDSLVRTSWVSLGVDYGPDMELAAAAKVAGIHTGRFPFKTHMGITRDYVTAALGYGAPSRLVWQSPDWVRPACGSHDWDDKTGVKQEICTLPRFHDGDHGDWQPDPERCETCGGTYVDHYGNDTPRMDHSYKAILPAVSA